MLKKKCSSCDKKVDRGFNYCPYCGSSFKVDKEAGNFGMLGRDDSAGRVQEELKLPFGMEKIMNSLISQLEKQMGNMDGADMKGVPKGVKIRIARGPQMGQQIAQRAPRKNIVMPVVSDKEVERRMGLPKIEVESKVKRLADMIIYEIEAPGVRRDEDIVLTELATGLEIKAYSKEKCYVKFIPLKVEVVAYRVEKERVVIELKG